jgi:hypothetical protein
LLVRDTFCIFVLVEKIRRKKWLVVEVVQAAATAAKKNR